MSFLSSDERVFPCFVNGDRGPLDGEQNTFMCDIAENSCLSFSSPEARTLPEFSVPANGFIPGDLSYLSFVESTTATPISALSNNGVCISNPVVPLLTNPEGDFCLVELEPRSQVNVGLSTGQPDTPVFVYDDQSLNKDVMYIQQQVNYVHSNSDPNVSSDHCGIQQTYDHSSKAFPVVCLTQECRSYPEWNHFSDNLNVCDSSAFPFNYNVNSVEVATNFAEPSNAPSFSSFTYSDYTTSYTSSYGSNSRILVSVPQPTRPQLDGYSQQHNTIECSRSSESYHVHAELMPTNPSNIYTKGCSTHGIIISEAEQNDFTGFVTESRFEVNRNEAISATEYWPTEFSAATAQTRCLSTITDCHYWPDAVYPTFNGEVGASQSYYPEVNSVVQPVYVNNGVINEMATTSVYNLSDPHMESTCPAMVQDNVPQNLMESSPLTCSQCMRVFSRPSHLEVHVRIHSGYQPHECVLCGRRFTQMSNLQRHLFSHKSLPQPEKFQDSLGVPLGTNTQSLGSRDDQIAITVRRNPRSKAWSCRVCYQSFSSYKLFRLHMIRHRSDRAFSCVFQTCFNTYETPDELLSHLAEAHRSSIASGTNCRNCGLSFPEFKNLVQHWLPRRRGLPPRCAFSGSKRKSDPVVHSATDSDRPNGMRHRKLLSRIRLLGFRKANGCRSFRTYRCPLCPRRCLALYRLRHHLTTVHDEVLSSLTHDHSTQATSATLGKNNVHPLNTSLVSSCANNTSKKRKPHRDSRSSRTMLFLLQVDEELSDSKNKKKGLAEKRKSKGSVQSVMVCQHCGKNFQKWKFFTDHELMCKQRIEEQARRTRLKVSRQSRFRITDENDSGHNPVPYVPQVPDPSLTSERCNLRRSVRSNP